jgi:hypothetical protein
MTEFNGIYYSHLETMFCRKNQPVFMYRGASSYYPRAAIYYNAMLDLDRIDRKKYTPL